MRIVRGVMLGALLPGALWVWYHAAAFGSPFYIANKFQNPIFLDVKDQAFQLWGIFSVPSVAVLGKLLFGSERGILFTQPWVLLAIPFGVMAAWRGVAREVAAFCIWSLAGLVLMNASFGAWHGGGSAGPRYLCQIFPAFAVWIGLFFDRLPRWAMAAFGIALGFAILMRSLIYSSTIEAPVFSLWRFYVGELARPSFTPVFRLYLFWLVLTGCSVWALRRRNKLT